MSINNYLFSVNPSDRSEVLIEEQPNLRTKSGDMKNDTPLVFFYGVIGVTGMVSCILPRCRLITKEDYEQKLTKNEIHSVKTKEATGMDRTHRLS